MVGVMADEMLRSIYWAADETIAQLDRLLSPTRDRERTAMVDLRDATARLGESSAPFVPDEPAEEGGVAPAPARRPPPLASDTPYVALPQRTTHGGPWGPAMRRKLIAEALAKGNVW